MSCPEPVGARKDGTVKLFKECTDSNDDRRSGIDWTVVGIIDTSLVGGGDVGGGDSSIKFVESVSWEEEVGG